MQREFLMSMLIINNSFKCVFKCIFLQFSETFLVCHLALYSNWFLIWSLTSMWAELKLRPFIKTIDFLVKITDSIGLKKTSHGLSKICVYIMIMRTLDPVVAYCIQIWILQFYWEGTYNTGHLTGYKITAAAFFVYIEKSWTLLEYKNLSPATGADGIFRSRGDCFRSTEALPRNFHPYRLLVIVFFPCVSFLEIKIGTNGFTICVYVCTLFLL